VAVSLLLAMPTTTTTLLVLLAAVLTGFVGTRLAAADFVHPPPYLSGSNRYQDNPRYAWGSNVTIEWRNSYSNNTDLVLALEFPRKIEHPDKATFNLIYGKAFTPAFRLDLILPELSQHGRAAFMTLMSRPVFAMAQGRVD